MENVYESCVNYISKHPGTTIVELLKQIETAGIAVKGGFCVFFKRGVACLGVLVQGGGRFDHAHHERRCN